MSEPPPDDDSSTTTGVSDRNDVGAAGSSDSAADRPEDAIEPSTGETVATSETDDGFRPPAAGATTEDEPREETVASRSETESEPAVQTEIDSNWWYWVAAVPIYVIAGIVAGILAGLLFLLGIAVDIGGGMGIATGILGVLVVVGSVGYGLVGLVLSLLFPIGIYNDAKAIEASAASWDPDPILYLLVAVASVLLTAFTVSLVVALYYLYRRNQAIGVP